MATIIGTEGDDYNSPLVGTAAGDVIKGLGGNDGLLGRQGNDVLYGGNGTDFLAGEDGNDTLYGGAGNDIMEGDKTNAGDDNLFGGDGIDRANYSGDFPDVGAETILLYAGNFTIGGQTVAYGTADGAAGHDTLFSIENVLGSQFDDYIRGNADPNTLYGMNGSDIVMGEGGDDELWGDANYISGGGGVPGDDKLFGGAGDDKLHGEESNDKLMGGAGADKLDGGAGFDTGYYSNSTVGVVVQLYAGAGHQGDAEGDTYVAIEAVSGSSHADRLYGDAGGNHLLGLGGDDLLGGGGGNDVLTGGTGQDDLYGGTGTDRFVFNTVADSPTGGASRDVIHDFSQIASDTIDLHAIDAHALTRGDQAFTWQGTGALTGLGQLHVVYGRGGVAIVEGNVTGSTDPDFQIVVLGNPALTAGDFIL